MKKQKSQEKVCIHRDCQKDLCLHKVERDKIVAEGFKDCLKQVQDKLCFRDTCDCWKMVELRKWVEQELGK